MFAVYNILEKWHSRPVLPTQSKLSKAAFPLTRLGTRRVATAELKIDQIQSQCDLSINSIGRAASNRTCSDFCVHPLRVHLPIYHFIYSWRVFRHVWQSSKHETLNQCWFNAGLSSAMLTEHLFKISSTSHIARLL